MTREAKWALYIIAVIVAAFVGAGLSSWLRSMMSSTGELLFILAMLVFVVGFVVWNLSGNKRIAQAGDGAKAEALRMQPAPGKAAIYIVRKGFVGMLQGFDFTIEGVKSGQAKGNQFLHAEVEPGTYRLTAKAKASGGEAEVTLGAGEVAVFRVGVEPGMLTGAIVFDRLHPDEGRPVLAATKMVLWTA